MFYANPRFYLALAIKCARDPLVLFSRELEAELRISAQSYPIVTIVGPRQSGKTTLAKMVFPDKAYRSLENPDTRAYANEDPRGFFAELPDGAILDEIQRAPELLSYLQGIVDGDPRSGLFVLTGSHHFLLMQGVSQSLAGRTAIATLLPLSLAEIPEDKVPQDIDTLIFNGSYPRIYERGIAPYRAMRDYFQTYVERDVRSLLRVQDLSLFETFVRLCAGRVGQLLNLTSLANDVGISPTTAKEWISILETSFILHRLPPWHANIGKRLIKTPKLYFHDTALAAYLLGIEQKSHLSAHPLRGQLFENAVIAELIKARFNSGKDSRICFYRERGGTEIDALFPVGPGYIPIEIKSGQTVSGDWFKAFDLFAKARKAAFQKGIVVYGGKEAQDRTKGCVCSIFDLRGAIQKAAKEGLIGR